MDRCCVGCACSLVFISCSAPRCAHADPVTLAPAHRSERPGDHHGRCVRRRRRGQRGRAIAPAPPPGQISTLSMRLLAAAASAAGLDLTPPAGVTRSARGAPRRRARDLAAPRSAAPRDARRGDPARRNRARSLSWLPACASPQAPRAVDDGAVGDSVRLVNVASNRTIDADRHRPRRGERTAMNKDASMRRLALHRARRRRSGLRQQSTMQRTRARCARRAGRCLQRRAPRAGAAATRAGRPARPRSPAAQQQSMPQPEPAAYRTARPIRCGAPARAASSTISARRASATSSP